MNTRLVMAVATLFAVAAQAQPRWKLTETLRIGGAETGPELFQYVKSIEADSKGRILIYDRKTQDIRIFDQVIFNDALNRFGMVGEIVLDDRFDLAA